jgi:hypothetical protein
MSHNRPTDLVFCPFWERIYVPEDRSHETRIEGGVVPRHGRGGVASQKLKDVDRKIVAFKQAARQGTRQRSK